MLVTSNVLLAIDIEALNPSPWGLQLRDFAASLGPNVFLSESRVFCTVVFLSPLAKAAAFNRFACAHPYLIPTTAMVKSYQSHGKAMDSS